MNHHKKEKILQCAENLFLTEGFKKITMDIIAKKLKISKKTIYIHFKNKEDLVNDVVVYSIDTLKSKMQELQLKNSHPIDEMFEIKKLVSNHLLEEKSSPLQQLKTFYETIYILFYKKAFELINGSMQKNISKGIDQGIYKTALPTDLMIRFYFMGTMGIRDEFIFPKAQFNPQYLDNALLWYHLGSTVTPKGEKYLKENYKLEQ